MSPVVLICLSDVLNPGNVSVGWRSSFLVLRHYTEQKHNIKSTVDQKLPWKAVNLCKWLCVISSIIQELISCSWLFEEYICIHWTLPEYFMHSVCQLCLFIQKWSSVVTCQECYLSTSHSNPAHTFYLCVLYAMKQPVFQQSLLSDIWYLRTCAGVQPVSVLLLLIFFPLQIMVWPQISLLALPLSLFSNSMLFHVLTFLWLPAVCQGIVSSVTAM